MKSRLSDKTETFRLEEATIADLHQAIQSGLTTCVAVVQRYIDRVRAFNGVASMLVTEDGAAVPQAQGPVRAQAPIGFPTTTVKASAVYPISTSTAGHRLNTDAWSRPRRIRRCSNSSA